MRVQEGRGSVKTPLFLFKKNIKFLILWIDNIGAIVYYLIKIKGIRRKKNGRKILLQNDGKTVRHRMPA